MRGSELNSDGNAAPGPVACESCDLAEICKILDNASNRLPTGRFRSVRAGEVLYRAGARAESLFAIRKGMLKRTALDRNNRMRLLAIHVPGDALGIEGLDCGSYANDTTALTPTICCELPREAFSKENLVRVPELSFALDRLRNRLQAPGRDLTCGSLAQRAKLFYCDLAQRLLERGSNPRRLAIEITREEMGSLFGRGVDSLRRALKRLSREGVIQLDGTTVRLGPKALSTRPDPMTGRGSHVAP